MSTRMKESELDECDEEEKVDYALCVIVWTRHWIAFCDFALQTRRDENGPESLKQEQPAQAWPRWSGHFQLALM